MNPHGEQAIKSYLEQYPQLANREDDLRDLIESWNPEDKYIEISCEPGWFDLIIATHKSLKKLNPNYKIETIKEKLGTLRFYISPLELRSYDPDVFAFNAIWHYAEWRSGHICERCGEDGTTWNVSTRSFFGWYHTFCDVCELTYATDRIQKYEHNHVLQDVLPAWETYRLSLEASIERRKAARERRHKGEAHA